jgi:hypothetical protein
MMARERIIWRPNSIAPEIWEAMSREKQFAWWKSQPGDAPPKRHMKTAIGQYYRGIILRSEFPDAVFRRATLDEIDEFLNECPADLLLTLKESLDAYGEDESAWPHFLCSACFPPWVTQKEIEESERKAQENIWNGVRLLKKSGRF